MIGHCVQACDQWFFNYNYLMKWLLTLRLNGTSWLLNTLMCWNSDRPWIGQASGEPYFPKPMWLFIWLFPTHILHNKTAIINVVFPWALLSHFSKFFLPEGTAGISKFIANWLELWVTTKTCGWCLNWGQTSERLCS